MEIAVVGGGISGLSTAYAIQEKAVERGLDVTVRLLESEDRLGGKIDTRHVDGFVVEGGVNGWLDSKPATDAVCEQIGLTAARMPANDEARKRFILRHGRLQCLPESPFEFIGSGLMSLGGKLRMMREPWADPPPDNDESVAGFARRRLGPEALEALLDPMVSGIFAGDPDRMSLKSCFPRIAEIERQYGGLVKGMFKIQRERRRELEKTGVVKKGGSPSGPGGKLISFSEGSGRLVEGLRVALKTAPETGVAVEGVEQDGAGYRLRCSGGKLFEVDRVVLATPAYATARIVDGLDADLARETKEIPYAAVAVVALGWKRDDMPHDLDGFGYVVPFKERREILGTLWDSSLFEHRAPDGYVLTRSMVGGMRTGELAMRPEVQIIESVRSELRQILGVSAAPEIAQVVVHERAIPQYPPGHAARMARIDDRLARFSGLLLTGNAYRGVGLNDCTGNSVEIAAQILA